MDGARRLFNSLAQRETSVLEPTPVDEIQGAVRHKDPRHSRNGINHQAELPFTLAPCLFGLSTVGNVLRASGHPDRISAAIHHDGASHVNNSRLSIGPGKTTGKTETLMRPQGPFQNPLRKFSVLGKNKLTDGREA